MAAIALFNPKSGSVPPDAREKLSALLSELNVANPELVETDPEDCDGQIQRLAAKQPDLFIVWGGDGTIRTALNLAGHITDKLLILPGGTMNLLPKAIHGDKPWDQILRDVIGNHKTLTLPAGKVNGEMFYCAMLAGAPAHFAEVRENLRKGDLGAAAAAGAGALDTLKTLQLAARYADGHSFVESRLPVSSVVGAVIGSLTRAGSGMEVAALARPTTTGALNVVWTSFFNDWRKADGVEVAPAISLDVENDDGGDIPMIVDGEHLDVGPVAHIDFIENASQCLAAK
jgi:diacylglycerol kinase family enzyme